VSRRARWAGRAALALVLVLSAFFFWPAPAPGPTGQWMAAAGLTSRFVDAEGLRLRYVRTGQGPPVLLLHGFSSSLFTWKDVLPELARTHDVIALDLPGHGGSDIPAAITPELLARVVPNVLDQLAVPRASFVGNSLGGALSMVVAARTPARVDRLVLIDSAGFNFESSKRPALLRALTVLPGARLLEHSPRRRSMVGFGLRQVFHDDTLVTRERIDEYLVPVLRPRAVRTFQELLSARDALGFPGIVPEVQQPTLVIWGRQDAWIPVTDAERFRAALPRATVVVLEGCGHMPQEERPQETTRLIVDILGTTQRPR
jgi:pimeloyl-ACP methyl ester carboxylesterase